MHRPRHRHFQHIVVPMPIRVAAFPVNTLVFGFAQFRRVQPVRSREPIPPRQRDFHARAPFPALTSTKSSGDSYSLTLSTFPLLIFGSSSFQITAAMFSHVGICPVSSGTS